MTSLVTSHMKRKVCQILARLMPTGNNCCQSRKYICNANFPKILHKHIFELPSKWVSWKESSYLQFRALGINELSRSIHLRRPRTIPSSRKPSSASLFSRHLKLHYQLSLITILCRRGSRGRKWRCWPRGPLLNPWVSCRVGQGRREFGAKNAK